MVTEKNNDIRWIVGGAVAILVVGMILVTFASIFSRDSAATVAAIGGMIATGLGGLFALHKVQESNQKTEKAMAENTKVTEEVKEKADSNEQKLDHISHQLNGNLDARIRDSVANGIAQFRASFLIEVREIMKETLAEWESTKT